ncbi:Myosin-2A [Diplonema papillatum]|nr:Myosin-2A [Diplonema papillatum]
MAAHSAEVCFYPSATHVWVLGVVAHRSGENVQVSDCETGELMHFKESEIFLVHRAKREELLTPTSDLAEISAPHEAIVLHWLRNRVQQRRYCTRLGGVLLQFACGVEPVTSCGAELYLNALSTGRPQAVCVMGSSDAEKHLFTASLLRSLLRCGNATSAFCERLSASLTLLKYFACVRRVGGSSTRAPTELPCFTAVWSVSFTQAGSLAGVRLAVGGLEATRALSTTQKERMINCMYMLFSNHDHEAHLASAHLPQLTDEAAQPDDLDQKEYLRSARAFSLLNVGDSVKEGIWNVVAAVLHISSIEVTSASTLHPSSVPSLNAAADLLGVGVADLSSVILQGQPHSFSSVSSTRPSPSATRASRDTLACLLYTTLFNYIVENIINVALHDALSDANDPMASPSPSASGSPERVSSASPEAVRHAFFEKRDDGPVPQDEGWHTSGLPAFDYGSVRSDSGSPLFSPKKTEAGYVVYDSPPPSCSRRGASSGDRITTIAIIDAAGHHANRQEEFGIEEFVRHCIVEVLENRYREEVITKRKLEAAAEMQNHEVGIGVVPPPGPSSEHVVKMLFSTKSGLLTKLCFSDTDVEFHSSVSTFSSPLAYTIDPCDPSSVGADTLPFVVHHTFGPTRYDATLFVDARKPAPRSFIELVTQRASLPLLQLFDFSSDSIVTQLKTFLAGLVRALPTPFAAGDVTWVRCLASSPVPGYWSGHHVAEQLQYLGVMPILHFSRGSHDTTVPHAAFVKKFSPLLPWGHPPVARRPAFETCLTIVQKGCSALPPTLLPLSVGKGSVLLLSPTLRFLHSKVLDRSSAVMLAFMKYRLAIIRATTTPPPRRPLTKESLILLRQIERAELSRRAVVTREEKRVKDKLCEAFKRKFVQLASTVKHSIAIVHASTQLKIVSVEERKRGCLMQALAYEFRSLRDLYVKETRLLKRQLTLQSLQQSAVSPSLQYVVTAAAATSTRAKYQPKGRSLDSFKRSQRSPSQPRQSLSPRYDNPTLSYLGKVTDVTEAEMYQKPTVSREYALDVLATKVSERIEEHGAILAAAEEQKQNEIQKLTEKTDDDLARRRILHLKAMKEESNRQLLLAKRLEVETKLKAARLQKEEDRQRVIRQRTFQEMAMQRKKHVDEQKRAGEVEIARELDEWETMQRQLVKDEETKHQYEKHLHREKLRMAVHQQRAFERAEGFDRARQLSEMQEIEFEERARELEQAHELAVRKDANDVWRKKHEAVEAEKRLLAEEKRVHNVEWARNQLAQTSLAGAAAHMQRGVGSPGGGLSSPIVGRRALNGDWVQLSYRLGLSPSPRHVSASRSQTSPGNANLRRDKITQLTTYGKVLSYDSISPRSKTRSISRALTASVPPAASPRGPSASPKPRYAPAQS